MSVMALGEPIAGTTNLYAWGEGQILKLYGEETPAGFVEWLGRLERALHAAGLPVPEVGDIVEIGGCLGQIYERVEGRSMAEDLLGLAESDLDSVDRLAYLFAEVHAQIHTCRGIAAQVPSQRELLPTVIRRIPVLPPDLKEATLRALDELAGGDRLCHGDFHPYNLLMSPRGPVVIDWNNAHAGNPLDDVARSALILSGVSLSQPSYRSLLDRFNQAYLERYFQLRPGDPGQLDAWRPIVAAVRLSDDIPELEEWLLQQIRIGLAVEI
jgi:aminoglycoside phosphotransferase (APT) family kinase protein